jgi:hypothetical protein
LYLLKQREQWSLCLIAVEYDLTGKRWNILISLICLASSLIQAAAFDACPSDAREPPEMPSTTDIEYPRAASWASGTLENLIDDPKGWAGNALGNLKCIK